MEDTSAVACCCERVFALHQDCRLARATEGLTVGDGFAAGKLDNNSSPSCHTLFLFLQSRFPFVFFFDGSKRHPRKVRNRSETCQKQRWVQDSAHPSTHPSIHLVFRFICPKSGSYCIGNRRQAVDPCMWEHQRSRLLL